MSTQASTAWRPSLAPPYPPSPPRLPRGAPDVVAKRFLCRRAHLADKGVKGVEASLCGTILALMHQARLNTDTLPQVVPPEWNQQDVARAQELWKLDEVGQHQLAAAESVPSSVEPGNATQGPARRPVVSEVPARAQQAAGSLSLAAGASHGVPESMMVAPDRQGQGQAPETSMPASRVGGGVIASVAPPQSAAANPGDGVEQLRGMAQRLCDEAVRVSREIVIKSAAQAKAVADATLTTVHELTLTLNKTLQAVQVHQSSLEQQLHLRLHALEPPPGLAREVLDIFVKACMEQFRKVQAANMHGLAHEFSALVQLRASRPEGRVQVQPQATGDGDEDDLIVLTSTPLRKRKRPESGGVDVSRESGGGTGA